MDDRCRAMFESAGLEPFTYEGKGRPMSMSFHRAPEPLEDWAALAPFAKGALEAARTATAVRARRSGRPRRGGAGASDRPPDRAPRTAGSPLSVVARRVG